jgi:pyruvate/2-oxoglutarate dehydrogenase complex dihydrolipoamide dehydrogenase (E3) component
MPRSSELWRVKEAKRQVRRPPGEEAMKGSYDAIVIGSGQGGLPLAYKLADDGWKVAVVESGQLGGSCINYGCTPTKTMIASARIAHYARVASTFGIHPGAIKVNMKEVVARKNEVIDSFRNGLQEGVDARANLDLHRGHARFTGPHEIEVNGDRLASDKIFINTGTRPRILPIPGLDQVEILTNRNIMDLKEVPDHLIALGGNYLGLEFGQMFRRLGSEVTIIELADQIIPREDPEVSEALREALGAEGLAFHLGARTTKVAKTKNGLEVTIEKKDGISDTMRGSHLLVSIGQVPNSDELGLDKAGIETDQAGFIRHNNKLETNVAGVWVIGDVKGGPAFTHVSYDDYLVIYDNLVNGKNRTIENRLVPYALYTDPELGRVGLTEREARAKGHRLKLGSVPMAYVARAIERSETAGLMKVVINADNDRILGATILGPDGGELVQILMALMMADAPWTLFQNAMFIHPTLAEGFFALMASVKAA